MRDLTEEYDNAVPGDVCSDGSIWICDNGCYPQVTGRCYSGFVRVSIGQALGALKHGWKLGFVAPDASLVEIKR